MTFVALVDDHELLRSGLASMINSFEGFKVIMEAGNGKEFMEALKTTSRQPSFYWISICH